MRHAVEESPTFPYVAWAAVFAFSLLTVTLSIQLENEMTELVARKEYMESLLK